jgi:hypothetical protein
VLLLVFSGCRGYWNPFMPPGTMHQQQLKATVHDPYTEPDIGPEVVGGRPRDYQKPLAEPVRNRYIWDSWSNR